MWVWRRRRLVFLWCQTTNLTGNRVPVLHSKINTYRIKQCNDVQETIEDNKENVRGGAADSAIRRAMRIPPPPLI